MIPHDVLKDIRFAPLMRDVEAIAGTATNMTRYGHKWHVYLTTIRGELDFQDKTYVVSYAEPVEYSMDGYEFVHTFEPEDHVAPHAWFVSILLHRIRGVIETAANVETAAKRDDTPHDV